MSYIVAPNNLENEGLPAGLIMLWPIPVLPLDWLVCAGQAISRTAYPELFSLLGTVFGAGDGVRTFNLPNTSGREVRGSGALALGTSGGVDGVSLTGTALPNHRHTLVDPTHFHQQFRGGDTNITSSGGTPVQGNTDNVGSADTFPAVTGITMTDSLRVGGLQVTQVPLPIAEAYLVGQYILYADRPPSI